MIFKTIENKTKKFACAIILSVTMSGMALAAVEWNTAVTSEYIWRGMSQGKGAAVSGGIDISGENVFQRVYGSRMLISVTMLPMNLMFMLVIILAL